jgi:hypothetical protein
LFASLRPPTYGGDLQGKKGEGGEREGLRREPAGFGGGALGGRARAAGRAPMAAAPVAPAEKAPAVETGEGRLNLAQGVGSAASAAKLGDFFQYAIDKPVTLLRQKSALLPIVNKEIEGTRLSIYNEQTQPKYPLLGLRLKNTSGLHLMQGPITVFEGASYAGDARIMDLEPGEERLLSFAVDLGTEVSAVPSPANGRIVQFKVVKGILNTTTKMRETKTYTIANRNNVERLVLIEHPVRNDYHLVDADKPVETARDFYRFEVKVPAGKTASKLVTEERDVHQSTLLTNIDDNLLRYYISQSVASEALKNALTKALSLRGELDKTQQEIAAKLQQLSSINEDQARLRANMKDMPQTAAAYKRYLEKFDSQETQIEKIQAEVKELRATEQKQRREFEDFLSKLNVE